MFDSKSLAGAAVAAGVFAAGGAQAEDVVVPPDWVRKPTQQEMQAYLPGEAAKQGVDGGALIECRVGVDGLLRKCTVVSEAPEGLGFGPAALAVSKFFRMKPRTVNGEPTESDVRIPLKWKLDAFGAGAETVGVVTQPIWTAAPTRADLAAARPKGEAAGHIVLNCKLKPDGALSDCERDGKEGADFTRAARGLATKFRAVAPAKNSSFSDVRVLVPFQFDAPDSPAIQDARLLYRPDWSARPNPDMLEFPAAARAAGLKEGRALTECEVGAQGVLSGCKVLSESPAGLGFGAAALIAAARFNVNPWTAEGRPVDGARVRISLRYSDGEAATPAPTAAGS